MGLVWASRDNSYMFFGFIRNNWFMVFVYMSFVLFVTMVLWFYS